MGSIFLVFSMVGGALFAVLTGIEYIDVPKWAAAVILPVWQLSTLAPLMAGYGNFPEDKLMVWVALFWVATLEAAIWLLEPFGPLGVY